MEGRREIIATQFGDLEIEMGQGVCPVSDHLDVALSGFIGYSPDGQDLPGPIDQVSDVTDLGAGGER